MLTMLTEQVQPADNMCTKYGKAHLMLVDIVHLTIRWTWNDIYQYFSARNFSH